MDQSIGETAKTFPRTRTRTHFYVHGPFARLSPMVPPISWRNQHNLQLLLLADRRKEGNEPRSQEILALV